MNISKPHSRCDSQK